MRRVSIVCGGSLLQIESDHGSRTRGSSPTGRRASACPPSGWSSIGSRAARADDASPFVWTLARAVVPSAAQRNDLLSNLDFIAWSNASAERDWRRTHPELLGCPEVLARSHSPRARKVPRSFAQGAAVAFATGSFMCVQLAAPKRRR